MQAVVADRLVKSYGPKGKQTVALRDVSFTVNEGELFGLIGPDGAGKTSLFRILTTLLLADGGSASVVGCDVVNDYKTIRNRVGYMPGRFSLYPDLTVAENLNFFATIFNTAVEENYDLIKDIYGQIEPFKDRRAGKLSGGMKQKLALSCALIHRPAVLFLDEPTTGVDVVSRKEFWEILQRLKTAGITVLVSTPYMDEAKQCDRVALLQLGSILKINTPQGIVDDFGYPVYAVRSEVMLPLLDRLKREPLVKDAYPFGEYHHAVLQKDVDEKIFENALQTFHFDGLEWKNVQPDIEDCFMALMKTNDR